MFDSPSTNLSRSRCSFNLSTLLSPRCASFCCSSTRMDLERRVSFSCAPFSPTTVCNQAYDGVTQHARRNTTTQPTQISIQLLFSSFVTLRESRLLPRPIDGHVNVLAVHPESVLYVDVVKVACCIPSDRSCRPDTSCTSVFAFCRNTPTDTTPVPVHFSSLQDSVAPLSTTACLTESYLSCVRELAWPVDTHSFSHCV